MKTNILSNMNSVKNSFAKRVMMVIVVVMMASSAWGMSTSDIESSAATTITDGASYVIATAYNGDYLTPESYNDWAPVSSSINDAAIYTAHGSASGFYLTCVSGTMVVGASGKFVAYNSGTTNNLQLGGSGEIQSLANSAINLRKNTGTPGGGRWYNGSTGSSVYLYKITTKSTVTYSAEGGTCATSSEKQSVAGAPVTLPSASPSATCVTEGWVFAGWKQTSAQSETTSIPTLYAAGSKYWPRGDETLYAVYRLGNVYTIDFESAANSYTDWTFTRITSQGTDSYITAYGSYVGLTTTTNPNSVETNSKIASPKAIRFKISKTTANSDNSTWQVYTSDGSSWTSCKSQDAKSMYRGQWVEVSQDLSSYSNVYVKVEYAGSAAIRAIDDVVLSCATYNSNPSCCATSVALSKGTQTNATISSFSPSSVTTCGTGENDRKVTVTVAAATGYEFLSTARLTFAKTSGTATAEYVSGPTGTGPYTFVYQFTKDDNGDGTFSVTSATPKTYTITYLDQGGGAFTGTQAGALTTHTYGTATTLKIPTKFGNTFGGWYTAPDCASGAVGDASSASLAADGYTADITLYAKWTEKAVTNYRTSCCDYKVTFTQNDPENGTIAFSHSSLTTCGATDGERQRTMTITPDPGYKLKTFEVATGDGKVAASSTSPDVAVDEDNSDAQVITLTFAQNAEGNYDVTATFEEMHDEYYDYMHANAKQGANRTGVYNAPSLSSKTATSGEDCKTNHYKFKGWVVSTEINDDGTPKSGYTLITGGTSMTASNKIYYAVWAEEE